MTYASHWLRADYEFDGGTGPPYANYEWISLVVRNENADLQAPGDVRARIFPNPTTTVATVSFELTQSEQVRVRGRSGRPEG